MSDSTWRPDVPVELPDGTLVCSSHGLVICYICTCDYSFMADILAEADSDYDSMPALISIPSATRPATAAKDPITITRFTPPTATVHPLILFPGTAINWETHRCTPSTTRFVRATNPRELLILTDGACLNNGLPNPRGGCAFVFKPATDKGSGAISFRLENRGPTGELYPQTSNRAELRAVIAALEFRAWHGEGFSSLVIATDSEYVVEGATRWVNKWRTKGWKTAVGGKVKNRDLWEKLLGEVGRFAEEGLEVKFWRVGRDWNQVADGEAKMGAEKEAIEHYRMISGVMV